MLHILDSPFIKTFKYDNAEDFIQSISYKGELYNLFNNRFIFRGHSSDIYELLPSALRNLPIDEKLLADSPEDKQKMLLIFAMSEIGQDQYEYKVLQDFFQVCDKNGLYVPHIESLRNSFYVGVDGEKLLLPGPWLPKDYWELAALAQHHRVRTRLLDWTYDIHVALYFAATGVYYDPKEKRDMLADIRAIREGEKFPGKHDMEVWALNTDVVMLKPMKVPLRIIRPRYYNNDNLRAQKGAFTFWESNYPGMTNEKLDLTEADRRSLDVRLDEYLKEIEASKEIYLYQIKIPQNTAHIIYSYIDKLGYNASTIYPGYDGVARYIEERQRILH